MIELQGYTRKRAITVTQTRGSQQPRHKTNKKGKKHSFGGDSGPVLVCLVDGVGMNESALWPFADSLLYVHSTCA